MSKRLNRRRFVSGSALLTLMSYFTRTVAQKVPQSVFGSRSTAEEVTEGIDLVGKIALVTGCNSGIGYETMRVLALRGAHVIGTARSLEKGETACESVNATLPSSYPRAKGQATPVLLELTDFDSIVACVEQVQAMNVPIDILVCNAGVLFRDLQQVRGLEMQFVVNHLGHFILVNRLLGRMTTAPEGRIVVVGSVAHRSAPEGGIQFDDLSGEGWAVGAYGHSKLANGLFSLELARRLKGTNVTSNSLHPGGVQTNITRNLVGGMGGFRLPKTVEQGAATTCYVATSPELKGISGYYFSDCNAVQPGGHMEDTIMAAQLWEVSEALTRPYLN